MQPPHPVLEECMLVGDFLVQLLLSHVPRPGETTLLAVRYNRRPHLLGARRASAFRALFLELGFLHCVQPAQAVFRLACTMR